MMSEIRRVIIEFLIIGAVAVVFGLLANQLNADRIDLSRNYFAKPPAPITPPTTTAFARPSDNTEPAITTDASADDPDSTDDEADELVEPASIVEQYPDLAAEMSRYGVGLISDEEVNELYQDPAYAAGAYLFIDARDEESFIEGHIPGSYQVDHYRLGPNFDEVVMYCQGATKVVVYCEGGQCEDSALVVGDLIVHNVNPVLIHLYPGGFHQWRDRGMPVEVGPRGSGEYLEGP